MLITHPPASLISSHASSPLLFSLTYMGDWHVLRLRPFMMIDSWSAWGILYRAETLYVGQLRPALNLFNKNTQPLIALAVTRPSWYNFLLSDKCSMYSFAFNAWIFLRKYIKNKIQFHKILIKCNLTIRYDSKNTKQRHLITF